MGIAKQLYQLQELDLEIESNERALEQVTSQMGESREVSRTQNQLESAQQHLEELKHQQHSAEWEIDDIATKLIAAEETLFSGRVKNPKELTNLQHEVESLKAQRDRREDKTLEIMDQVEQSEAQVVTIRNQLEAMKAEWQRQQEQLSQESEKLKAILSDLEHKRQLLADGIEPQALAFYHNLREEKGTAVVRVEQGVCRGCRISLPTTDLQRARGGSLVQCSSCGRILFLA
jgi:predicted  nucleic acid-binding Zn-ribbon protein